VAQAPSLTAITGQVAARYNAGSHVARNFARNFVRGKLLTDPASGRILRLAAERGGFGAVADLGCGRGQLGLALLLAGLATRVRGIDLDPVKIRDAEAAAAGLPAGFAVGDLGVAEVPECDTAIMCDVLLQMPVEAQRRLLPRMAAARRRVLIRAFDPDRGWRAAFGTGMERLGCILRRDGSTFRPMRLAELAAPFEAAGFRVSVTPCWGWTPLPNVLLIAERPG
jgi:SAM-dependent methyltransferase